MQTINGTSHWKSHNVEEQTEHQLFHCYHKKLAALPHVVCLMGSALEYTDHEPIPVEVEAWLEPIGLDEGMRPNLLRLWGEEESLYALSFNYEVSQPGGSDPEGTAAHFHLSYSEQLGQLDQAARAIQTRLPETMVRLNEGGGVHERHVLEVILPFPTDCKVVTEAARVLKNEFSHIHTIGVQYGNGEPGHTGQAASDSQTMG